MTDVDFDKLKSALKEADRADVPLTHGGARLAAGAIKLALWRGHLDLPRELVRFIDNGSFNLTEFLKMLDDTEEVYDSGRHLTGALARYAEFHADATGSRDRVAQWTAC